MEGGFFQSAENIFKGLKTFVSVGSQSIKRSKAEVGRFLGHFFLFERFVSFKSTGLLIALFREGSLMMGSC